MIDKEKGGDTHRHIQSTREGESEAKGNTMQKRGGMTDTEKDRDTHRYTESTREGGREL